MAIYYSPYPNVAQPITTAPYSTATSDIYVTNVSALKKLSKGIGTTWGSYTPSTADFGFTTPYIPGLVVTAAPVIPTVSATAINPTISVTQNQSIGNTAVITAYGGSAVASNYTAIGNFIGYNVSIDNALPPGVSFTSTFATVKLVSSTDNKYYLYNGATITVSGTPTLPLATTNYTVSFTDASGSTARASFSLSVTSNQTPLSVTSAVTGNKILTQGVSSGVSGFATTNNPAGGSTPYKYAISPALPTGLTFNVNTGYVTGTPTVSLSNTTFTVTVTDSGATPQTASSTFSMTVTANVPVATLAVPTTQLTQGISFTAFTPVTGTGGTAPLRYSISPALPTGLTFSTSTGVVAGTPSVSSAAADYTVTVTDNLQQSAGQTFNLTVKSIQVLTAIQTQPVYNLYKSVAVTAFTPITYNGGYGTISYALTPSTLPAGLTFSAGSISGTPTSTSSTATYVVNLSDQAGQTASGTFALSVVSIPIAVTQKVPSTLLTKNATFNSFAPVTAAGGYTPYTYVVSPSLPSGLSYASGTGIISGTATATSVATYYLVTVTDAAAQSGTSSFNLTVLQPDALTLTRVINTITLVQGTAASPFTPISASGGYVPSGSSLNYSISPALTAGLSINGNTGQITGTPSAYSINTTTYSVTVSDQASQRSTVTFDLNVLTPVFSVVIAVPSTPGIVGVAVAAFTPVTATGGATPYQYELNTGLSAGLSFSTSTGRVSGTPTVANTSNYIVRITDAVGQTGTGSFNLGISQPVALVLTTVVTSTALVKSVDLANFTPVTAVGGQGSISLTVSPSLPAGLNFSNIGKITGTPTTESTQTAYLVKGTDSIGQTSSSTFYLAVNNSVLTSTVVVSISTLSQYVAITSFTPVTYVGGTPPVTYSISPSLSSGISINPSTGALSGTPQTTLSTTSYAITVTDNVGGKTTGTTRINVIAVPDLISTRAITTVTAYANQALTAVTPVTVTGGYGSNSYSVTPSLPAGLLFSSVSGQITGTPSQLSSTATYLVTVSNQVNQTTSTNFNLTVKAQAVLATASIPVSTLIIYQLSTPFIPVTGTGGFGSLSYQLTGANLSLPAGLSFNGSNGEVTGTPTALSETATYVVLVTDSISQTSTSSFTVSVAEVAPDPLNVTVTKSLIDITQNQSVSLSPVQVLGGVSPYAYTLTPALPAGLTFNFNGTITGSTGVVTSATTYNITVKDGQPQSITKTFSLTVSGGNVSGTGNVTQINNAANATNTTSGALIVAGGAGIAGNLFASAVYDNNNRVVTNVNPSGSTYIGIGSLVSTGTNVSFNITNLGVLTLTAGTDTAVSSNTGTITVWTTSTLQTVTNRGNTTTNTINITNTTVSAGTMSGALTVAGGIGVGGKIVAGDDIVTTRKIGAGTLTPGAPLEVAFSNSNYSPTAYSSIKLNNGNSAGQSSVDSFINGNIKSRIRTDYSGNLNFSAYGGSINFYIGGDSGQGTNYMNVNTAGTLTVVNTIVGTITTANNIAGGALGSIPYQTTAGNTAFIGIGSQDSILYTDGTTATWKLLSSLAAATSNTSTYSGNVFVNPVTPSHQYYIGLTEYIDDFSPLDGDSQLIYDTTDRSLSSTKLIVTSTNASTSSVTSNALYVAGGVGIGSSLYVTGPAVFQNNVTFSGTSTFVLSTNTVYTDNIIELHYPNTPGNTWAVNDLKDIGLRFHYYDTQDRNAFLGRDNATGYLEWIDRGVEDSTSTVSGTFGTFKTGSIILANNTVSNSTSTGALVVAGGIGVGGALYVGGDVTVLGKLNFTNASTPIGAGAATFSSVVITGTNATISTNSGALQVAGGAGISGGLFVGGVTTVTNVTNSTSTNNGALVVAGGVGIGNNTNIGGKLFINSDENATLYAGYGALQVVGGAYIAKDLTVGGSFKALGAFTVNGYSVSTATFNGGTVDNYTNFAPSTPTNSAVTGAVTIVGGLGVGGGVFVGGTVTATNFIGNVYAKNTSSIQVGFATTSGFALTFNTSTLVSTATSAAYAYSFNTSTLVSTATSAAFAYAFNTSTLVSRSVLADNATTATSAAFAYAFNTSTLIARAVLADTATTATSAAFAYAFNTSTLIARAVLADTATTATSAAFAYAFNTSTLIARAVLADTATTATSAAFAYAFNTGTLVSTAINLASGVSGQIPYQSAAGTTLFIATGTSGQFLVSNGSGAPSFSSTASLQVGFATTSSFALAFNTSTLVSRSVLADTATTATSAAFAYAFNTSTLIARAVLADTATTATGAAFAYAFNTGTLVSRSVLADTATTATSAAFAYAFNTGTLVARSVLADTATTATSAAFAYAFNTGTLVSTATSAAFAYAFNTSTLVATAVNIVNTSGTQVGYATTAGFAVTFNTGTLVANAVSATTSSFATTSGFAVTFNTGTLVANAVSATTSSFATTSGFALSFNTATVVATAVNIVNTSGTQVGFATTSSFALTFNTNTQVSSAVTATNIAGGTAGQIHYQSSPGVTSFINTGAVGTILVSNGTAAPVFQNTLTLSSTVGTVSTTTGALQVSGGVGIGGSLYVGGVVTATTFIGAFSGTSNFATTSSYANTATNVVISTASNNASYYITFVSTTSGSLGVVSDAGANLTYNPGTNILRIAGTATSTSTTTGALQVVGGVGVGGNIYAGNIYSNGQLVATGSAVFSGGNVSNIVNITTATGTTSTNSGALIVVGGVGIGGGVFVGGTVTATNFIGNVYAANTSTIIVGFATTATNISGGTAGQIHYQSSPGITTFINTGTVGTILVSNGTAAPVFQNTLTLAGTAGTISTTTGALQVAGGVGIGSGLYVGGISTASLYVSNGTISGSSSQGAFTYGALTYSDPNNFAVFQTSINAYAQIALQNSNAGTAASTDLIVSNDRGAAASYYGDFGMNSSGFTGVGSLNLPNAVYLASSQGDLVLGSFSNNSIRFVLNSGATDAITISTVTNNIIINTTATITSTVGVISTNTGALTVAGGVGIAGGLYVGGVVTATTFVGAFNGNSNFATTSSYANTATNIVITTASNNASYYITFVSTTSGSLGVVSDAGANLTYNPGTNILRIAGTATSTSTTTGALQIVGGVGIGGNIYAANIYSNGALVATGVAAFNGGNVSNIVYITTATGTTSTNTGALIVQGGIGVGGGGYFGGSVTATNLTTVGGSGQITGVYQLNATNINVTNLTATNISFAGGTVTTPLLITSTASSTSTTTGALIVSGGVGVGGSLYASSLYTAGGSGIISGVYQLNSQNISATGNVSLSGSVITVLTSTNTTTAVSTTTGALVIAGGVGVGGSVYAGSFVSQGGTGLISGVYQVSSQFFVSTATTTATSTTTGALQLAGGAGIGGNVYVGGNLDIAGRLTFANNSTATFGNLILTSTTTSVSSSTGALQVAGGVGIAGNAYIGGNLYVNNGSQVIPTTIQEFSATNGQTIFTPSSPYTVGTVQIFANGVALGNGDFTASNGTTFVLNQARVTGDIIRFIAGVSSTGVNNIKAFSIAMSIAMSG
jgi:hypothetical protein